MGRVGAPELLIILVVVMLLFGASRLPKLARSLGEASKEFRDAVKEGQRESAAEDAPTGAEAADKEQRPSA